MSSGCILITGGAGYIGSHMVNALVNQTQAKVVVFDNLSTGFADAVVGAELVIGDLLDIAALEKLFAKYPIETVMHFAACTVIPESIAHPLKYYQNNTVGTINLLAICRQHHVKHFIFSSTAAVYGVHTEENITEDHPIAPSNPYGHAKQIAEKIVQDVCKTHGMNYAILRYFNVAGAHPSGILGQKTPNASHLIKVAVETACGRRGSMPIFGMDYPTIDGSCIRDYIHVCDLADAHIQTLKYLENNEKSCILNCGYGQGFSVKQVIEALETVGQCSLPIIPSERRAGDLARVVADPTRLMQTLNWQPKFNDLHFIVKTAYEYEKRLQTTKNRKSTTSQKKDEIAAI